MFPLYELSHFLFMLYYSTFVLNDRPKAGAVWPLASLGLVMLALIRFLRPSRRISVGSSDVSAKCSRKLRGTRPAGGWGAS